MKFIVTDKQPASKTVSIIERYCRCACTWDKTNRVWRADDRFAATDQDMQELISEGFVQVVADDYSAASKKVYSAADRAADDKEFFADQNPWIIRGR